MIIKIKNLRLKTILGIYEWEKSINRDIIINAKIETDDHSSMQSDDINDTIDYDVIIEKIKNFIKDNDFKLIERIVSGILDSIMEDKRIKKCTLQMDKVGVVDGVESLSVTDIREN